MIDAGELPALARIVNGGVSGTLRADYPLVSPILWTTAATGKTADAHGILEAVEIDPLSGRRWPPSGASRRAPALWAILAQAGLRCHVVDWPATHPAEAAGGVSVSDRFAQPTSLDQAAWPILAGAAHPPDVEPALLDLRVHPTELSGDDLRPFVPRISEIDQERDHRLVPLAAALAQTVTVHAAATYCLEHRSWDFAAVHYSLSGLASHGYMRYAPPRLEGVDERDAAIYGEVVRSAYRMQDAMLARLMELAGEDACVMVVSEHGFRSGVQRLAPLAEGTAWDEWVRGHGIFCLAGPGVRTDELVHGARLVDLAPTVLAMFGLPVGEDMLGRVLLDALEETALEEAPPLKRGPAYAVPEERRPAVVDAQPWLEQMGYADPLRERMSEALTRADGSSELHLAAVHLMAGRGAQALGPLEASLAQRPSDDFVRLLLAHGYLQAGRHAECEAKIGEVAEDSAQILYARMLRSRLYLVQGRTAEALAILTEVREQADSADLRCLLGEVYRVSNRLVEAEDAYRSALALDPDLVVGLTGLATICLAENRSEEAADFALRATGLDFGNPFAHYLLGLAWARQMHLEPSLTALRTCLKMDPRMAAARRLLEQVERARERFTGATSRAE